MPELYDYQTRAVTEVKQSFADGLKRVVVQAPTGAGKSVILHAIAKACVENGKRVLFAVHLREILSDFADRASDINVGIIAPGFNRKPFAPLQLITIQSAVRKQRSQLPDADVVLFDELQHAPAQTFSKIFSLYPDAFFVGTSATPCRADDKPLDMFDKLIVAAKYSELISAGKIVPAMVFQPADRLKNALACDPVTAYEKYGEEQKGFVFVRGIENAEEVARRFTAAGIPTVAVHSRMAPLARIQALRNLKSGAVRLLVSDKILTEGVNVPEAVVCILAGACNFMGEYMQKCGRVLRAFPGKKYAIVIDLIGASLTHGLPHIDREFTLKGKTYDLTNLAPLTVCPNCGLTQLAGRATCEGCAFTFLRQARKLPRIYSEELRKVFDFENTPEPARMEEFLRLLDESVNTGYGISQVVGRYKDLFGSDPPQLWLLNLPRERKLYEFENWKKEAEQKGWKKGYAYARYISTFGCPP